MKLYLAPMEGITGYIYRNAHKKYYNTMDVYMTPFISPNKNRCMNSRELEDVLPEHNVNMHVVAQILTNRSEQFVKTAKELAQLGYKEVNLNLGCPSGTVVSKKKGAGFLGEPHMLEQFLDEIFEALDGIVKISLKTRLGMEFEEEFEDLLDIYNKYPVSELIVHPRLREDYYKGCVRLDSFELAMERAKMPLCYNGDVFSHEDYVRLVERFPTLNCLMLGRGVLRNPDLPGIICGKMAQDKQTLRYFHDTLLENYGNILFGEKNLLFKMKELWFYLQESFSCPQKNMKKIKKAQHLTDYLAAVEAMFRDEEKVPCDPDR